MLLKVSCSEPSADCIIQIGTDLNIQFLKFIHYAHPTCNPIIPTPNPNSNPNPIHNPNPSPDPNPNPNPNTVGCIGLSELC